MCVSDTFYNLYTWVQQLLPLALADIGLPNFVAGGAGIHQHL